MPRSVAQLLSVLKGANLPGETLTEADSVASSHYIFWLRDALGKIPSSFRYNTLSPHKMTLSAMDDVLVQDDVLTQIGCKRI